MLWPSRLKIAISAIALAFLGVAIFIWRETAGISGEVFVVTNGRAMVMPGASVRLLKINNAQANKIMSSLGEKLDAYKLLSSVQEVVFVAHDEQRIDVVRRDGANWIIDSYRPGQAAKLASIGCAVDVDDVYRDPLSR